MLPPKVLVNHLIGSSWLHGLCFRGLLNIFEAMNFLVQFLKGGSPMGDSEPVSFTDLEPSWIKVSEIEIFE